MTHDSKTDAGVRLLELADHIEIVIQRGMILSDVTILRSVQKVLRAAPARCDADEELQPYLDGKAIQNDGRVHLDISFNELKKLRAALRTWNEAPAQCDAKSAAVLNFARAILHGDDVHRQWLLEAAQAFVTGEPLPPPRAALSLPATEGGQLNSGAPQPRGEPVHTNATQPIGSSNTSATPSQDVEPKSREVVWLSEVDAGTDNACWVISNRVDADAVPFFRGIDFPRAASPPMEMREALVVRTLNILRDWMDRPGYAPDHTADVIVNDILATLNPNTVTAADRGTP